ncbi:MAG: phosphoribosylaminoimidazolesuccinocarboxamide synthase [Bdellovibrionales bacterium RBG_16_40_8]|nr:MAG: phosphoribosylaminoimidazolesuccinocarboxamide synthase [Bdellovibrionales bacterium RBG_16_40_8]
MSTAYQKGELIYEGKGKKVFQIKDENNFIWIDFKDSLTAFNAQKKGSFESKGAINRDIASMVFRYLKKNNIDSHWVADVGVNSMICEKLQMIPLEVVVRNVVAGSFAKKFGLEEGIEIPNPIAEFYYKKDELNDPFISDDQALYLMAARSQHELDSLKKMGLLVNVQLKNLFAKLELRLVDFKLEFGFNYNKKICLGDEITPDSCRLWDLKTNEKFDKDRFRRDLGGVSEAYQEVLNRMRRMWGSEL